MPKNKEILAELYSILSKYDKEVYEPADSRTGNTKEGNVLYLIDKAGRDELIVFEKDLEALLNKPSGKALSEFASFINPSLPIRRYWVKTKRKHQRITERKQVLKEIDHKLYFDKKSILEQCEDVIRENEFDDAQKTKIRAEAHKRIALAEAHNQILKKYKDQLDMKIIDIRNEKVYNEIRCYYRALSDNEEDIKKSKEMKTHHLSIKKPTIIWYEEENARIDEKTLKFINSAIDAQYGGFYYVPFDDSELSVETLQQEIEQILKEGGN